MMALDRKGMTLIEVTVMIVAGGFLIFGISQSAQTQLVQQTDMRDYGIALGLAARQMAVMNNGSYPSVGTTNPSSDASFGGFNFTQTVTEPLTSGSDSVRLVQLDVTRASDSKLLARLHTYRTNTCRFGNGS